MSVELVRLVVDFGFLILIWAVQLIIYPSFNYYNETNLVKWHQLYTKRVAVIVLPLMMLQLILGILHLILEFYWYTVLSLLLIIALWLLTFVVFVPLHMSIDNNTMQKRTCEKLVEKNKFRTFLWSILFLLTLCNYMLNIS